MTQLTAHAKEELEEAGFTPWAWARHCFGSPTWRGDRCGCSDDRCIGYHHDNEDDCQCLPALLQEHAQSKLANQLGVAIWAAHQYACSTRNDADREYANELGAGWINQFKKGSATSWGFVREGIAYRNRYNDDTWLVWSKDGLDTPDPIDLTPAEVEAFKPVQESQHA